jgi:hypothetical protein
MHTSPNPQDDRKVLLAIVEEMSKSMTGAQSTKHWANDALWFDVPPFASKGVEPARRERRGGRWQIIHEHLSTPMGQGWDGTIVSQ